jgi:hypothetical protein
MGDVFSETIISPGSILYKGLPGIGCASLLHDTRAFYLTDNPKTAQAYGIKCSYRAKKTLRLFDITDHNLSLLYKVGKLSPTAKHLIQLSFGTGISLKNQVNAIEHVVQNKSIHRIRKQAKSGVPGQRASYLELNKRMDAYFIREFLDKGGYDGYYSSGKHSVFHKGKFRAEIMLSNAYQKIERTGFHRLPVVSLSALKYPQTISRLFLEYCRKGPSAITRQYRDFTIFCTGGQALNIFLRKKLKNKIPEVIRKTYDFDLSFGVPRPLSSTADVVKHIERMRQVMITQMNGFVTFVNRHYKGANAKLRVTRVYRQTTTHPAVQIPATNRRVYSVFTWQIVIDNKSIDVCDSALAVYPGISHSWVSNIDGVPIGKLKYQFKDLAALLSGSFLYRKQIIGMRNPLRGQKANKGLRNTWRMESLIDFVQRHNTVNSNTKTLAKLSRPLVKKILNKNFKGAVNASRKIDTHIRKK